MYKLWWQSIFTTFFLVIVFMNLALAFDMLGVLNPTSDIPTMTQHDYYFGFSSIQLAFSEYFGTDSNILTGISASLTSLGAVIQRVYSTFDVFSTFAKGNPAWEIISAIFALVMFTNAVIPIVLMLMYGLLYIIYILAFAFYVVFFIFKLVGGYYVTPYTNPYGFTPITSSNPLMCI